MQIDALQKLSEHGDPTVIATGIPELDERLNGGARPGDLIILGGRPSMGKTAAGLTVALNIAARDPVGFWSGEMTKAQLTQRAIAQLGRVSLSMVQRPNLADTEFWTRVCDATERAQGMRLFIDDQPGLTFPQLRAKARAMKRKHGIKLLVVDYLQLMSGTDTKLSRNYQLEEISRGLKALAKSLGIAVVALAQVNRDATEMPSMRDLRDSGAIEQDADIITFVHRPIVAKPDLGDEWKQYAQWFIAKNRQGETCLIDMTYIGNETRFTSWFGQRPQAQGAGGKRGGRNTNIDF
jgi:replicative DNA helicase